MRVIKLMNINTYVMVYVKLAQSFNYYYYYYYYGFNNVCYVLVMHY